jgi:hypothetical protein
VNASQLKRPNESRKQKYSALWFSKVGCLK